MDIRKYDIVYVKNRASYGCLQAKDRPAIVLQNNRGNKHSPNTIVAFMTGQVKRRDLLTHVVLYDYALSKNSMVLLEQIATVSKDDIIRKIDTLRVADRVKVDAAMMVSLGMIDLEGA